MLGEITPEAAAFVCLDTMTVGAAHFALGYFGFDSEPVTALSEQAGYMGRLMTAYMIEFE